MTHDENTLSQDSSGSQAFQQQKLGDYQLLSELGRGGMGVVYKALQISLNRQVALKVLSCNLGLTNKSVKRFRREAEAAAKLHHTNIVPIYAIGEDQNVYYYSMELIDGPSLDVVIAELRRQASPSSDDSGRQHMADDATSGGLSSSTLNSDGAFFDTVARMIAQVADALDHAHQQGVVHRDVKPSNLLVSSQGRLSVNDFGLARLLEQPGMTITGEILGTPRYMSPEQIAAGRVPIDHRADIYSLGVTLYELLTLHPPFAAGQRDKLLAQILQKEPQPLRKLNPKVPVDLETICLKAMEKDPDQRYATAGQMAEDLRRYLNRFAISARRVGPIGRIKKWTKRNPALASVLAALVVCGLAAVALGYRAYAIEQRRVADAVRHKLQLVENDLKILEEQRSRVLEQAFMACRMEDFERAKEAIQQAEDLQCSKGQIQMLRGQQELFKGNVPKAIEHLGRAVELLPDSVAARSMLAMAHDDNGQITEYQKLLEEISNMTAVKPDDYLFLGLAESRLDPKAGLKSIDQAMQLSPSHFTMLTQLVRAEILRLEILESPELDQARSLMEDIQFVKRNAPQSATLLALSAKAHLSCYLVFGDLGKSQLRQRALDEGMKDADELSKYKDSNKATVARWTFLKEVGHPPDIADLQQAAIQDANAAACAAIHFYQMGQFKQAFAEIDKHADEPSLAFIRALCAMETPHGNEVLQEIDSANSANPPQSWDRFNAQLLLRLRGKLDEAIDDSQQFLEEPQNFPPVRQNEFKFALEYCAGQRTAEDLVKSLQQRGDLCNAHLCIALTELAKGNRAAAVRHLQQSLATRYYEYFPYQYSSMLLSRMRRDPAWPQGTLANE